MASGRCLRLLAVLSLIIAGGGGVSGCYTSIFSFGDSITDTGNAIRGSDRNVLTLPYGETYFGYSTGRYSDGRLIVDFIAEALGLPLLPPYLAGGTAEDFRHGVNFAYGGATALNASFFVANGFSFRPECDLATQIEWFKEYLHLLCAGSDCKFVLSNSLILMGEIGGGDCNYDLFDKESASVTKIQSYVPSVINAISDAIQVLITFGATTFIVPGNFPIGCLPAFLTTYQSVDIESYDTQTGCSNWMNEISKYHNSLLLDEINRLRELHPHVTIMYADYYEAALNIYRSPEQFGFNASLSPCCGSDDGPYHFNASISCGSEGSKMCSDPSTYMSWDGLHFTEATYRIIARSLIDGTYTYPSFSEKCAIFRQSADS